MRIIFWYHAVLPEVEEKQGEEYSGQPDKSCDIQPVERETVVKSRHDEPIELHDVAEYNNDGYKAKNAVVGLGRLGEKQNKRNQKPPDQGCVKQILPVAVHAVVKKHGRFRDVGIVYQEELSEGDVGVEH